jgi:hypothetical protein
LRRVPQASERTYGLPRGLLLGLRALDCVQNLIALIDPGPRLLLARKASGVSEIADNSAVSEMQFRREVELRCHASRNGEWS